MRAVKDEILFRGAWTYEEREREGERAIALKLRGRHNSVLTKQASKLIIY